ncbi:MAG: class I SAM-dependent methyltransferase [Hydrogenophaga sp.]|nr:class I SAM-dependent methyltransferase [Hydrogenophaga sp.]
MTTKSNSSAAIGFLQKLAYNARLFLMRLEGGNQGAANAKNRIEEIKDIVKTFESKTGLNAKDSSVIEIGFGARPERAFAMTAFFKTVTAIDLDSPVLSLKDIPQVFKRNGMERGIKSTIRHLIFDTWSWKQFHQTMQHHLGGYDPDRVKFIIGNAGNESTWENASDFQLAFSTDVFEHIPKEDLTSLLTILRRRLSNNGLVITRPMVFTGICGGHDLDWYPSRVATNDSANAWSHLTDPDFSTNTFLNRLTRRDYLGIFHDTGFQILRDTARMGDNFGIQHLTQNNRSLLSSYDDYELFSNQVEFLLR